MNNKTICDECKSEVSLDDVKFINNGEGDEVTICKDCLEDIESGGANE